VIALAVPQYEYSARAAETQKRTWLDTARPLHLRLGLLGVTGRALDGLKEEADVLDNVLDGPVQLRDWGADRASLVALPLLGAL
jgi:hypothetical protein